MSITGNPREQRRAEEGMLRHILSIYISKSTHLQFFVSGSIKKANSENCFPFDFSGQVRRINILFCLRFPLEYVVDCDFKVLIALWEIISAQ